MSPAHLPASDHHGAPPATSWHTPGAKRTPRGTRTTGVLVTGGLVSAVLTLTACAPSIYIPPAGQATDPICAEVVLALPRELNGFPRIKTSSQATAAWGDSPHQAIKLRCGTQSEGPTSEQCVTVTDSAGREVDWITVQDAGTKAWTMTTYGRSPGVEVTIPDGMSTSFAVELGAAVSKVPAQRFCTD